MFLFRLAAAFALFIAAQPALAQQPCASRLFLSGYASTVHVYDACSGAYLRDLDSRSRIVGAQAVKLGPDGLIYVVSEESSSILRYRNDTLDFVDVFAVAPIAPTGIAFDNQGRLYVAGYNSQSVQRFGRDGKFIDTAMPPRAAGVGGPDNGMTFGPDGLLYVPGYDSSNVVRYDIASGQASVAIPPRAAGLFHARGILPSRDGQWLFITGEGSGQVLRYQIASGAVSELTRGLGKPTGIAYGADDNLVVVSGSSVVRIDPATGALLGTLVPSGAGGVLGPTYVAVIPKAASVNPAVLGSQYWIVGEATLAGNVLEFPAYTALGTNFGDRLVPAQVQRVNWGTIRIEFQSCTRAALSWASGGTGSGEFGNGGYQLERFWSSEMTARCEQQGFASADKSWVNGMWWGGASRSGEGFLLDRRSDGYTFLAWFTYRPQ
jgi:sugar lactone lactonase YvrE